METMPVQELRRRCDAGDVLQLIDVRSASEYCAGHVPGAMNIPVECIESRLADLNATQELVLICQSGKRAAMVYQQLHDVRDRVWVLEGGTTAWKAGSLPTVREQAATWSIERQVRLLAGIIVLAGTLGSLFWKPALGFAIFIGAGLTFAALSGWCGMALLLAKLPWNRVSSRKPDIGLHVKEAQP